MSLRKANQALHKSQSPQRFKRLYVVCDQMDQADTGVHQLRDENSTSYEAEPGSYIGPIGVLA